MNFLVPLHPLNNFDITNYFNYEPRFDGAFSRNRLHITKDGAYVIDLDHKKSKGTHCILLFIDINTAVYFDSFGIEYIHLEILNKIGDKSITRNIFRIQDNDFLVDFIVLL